MEVRYVSSGIANRFENHIELNEHLPEYPELHDAILKHELAHTDTPGFTKKDFLLDIGPSRVNYWKLFKFMCIYPKTFMQFLPFYKKGNTFFYDINLCIVWGTIITAIGLSAFFSMYL